MAQNKRNITLFLLKWCFLIPVEKTELGRIGLLNYRINRKLQIVFFVLRLCSASCAAIAVTVIAIFFVNRIHTQDFIEIVTSILKHCSEESLMLIFCIKDCFASSDILKILNALHVSKNLYGANRSDENIDMMGYRKYSKIMIIICMVFGMVKPIYEIYKLKSWSILVILLIIKHLLVLQATIYVWITLLFQVKQLFDNANCDLRVSLLKQKQPNKLTAKLKVTRKLYCALFIVTKNINSYFGTKLFWLISFRYCNILFSLFELHRTFHLRNADTWIFICSIAYYYVQIFAVVTVCNKVRIAIDNLIETIFEVDRILGSKTSAVRKVVSKH